MPISSITAPVVPLKCMVVMLYVRNTYITTGMKTQNFQVLVVNSRLVGGYFEEMEHGIIKDYSDVSEPTARTCDRWPG